ncbi:UNVERIFIED_CONTAM: hypothetical protein N8J90_03565 [Halobacillus marinus]
MKKWLLALGLTSAIVVAGCSSDDESAEENTDQTEQTDEKSGDEQDAKKAVIDAQMNMKDTFHPYQEKITAYQTAASAEEPDAEAVKAAGKEAKTAADEAAEAATGFEVEADVSDEVKTQIEEAVPSLQAYYEEVSKALDESIEEADFTAADEKAAEFNEKIGKVFEDAGLAAPDMMKELS